jgi:nucleolar protein 56
MGQLAYFAKTPIGIFVFSEQYDLLYFRLFSKSPEKALDEFSKATADIAELKNYKVSDDPDAYRILRPKFREYAVSLGFAENDEQLNRFLAGFGILLSRKKLVGMISRDRLIIQASNAAEDLAKVINLFQERLYEWFSLHYPEVRNSKDLAGKVVSYGSREKFPGFEESTGVDLNEKDEEILMEFAASIQSLLEEKEGLENYVKESMTNIAPNLSSLINPLLAARLVALAGSLEKFARMPASTIQLLGAEKALFRHLKKKGKSPKYGIIYINPLIQNASRENKGKVARILSAQLMKAARIDFYSGRYEPKLKEELDEEISRVR